MLRIGVTMRQMQTAHEQRDALATDWGRFLQQVLPGTPWMPLPNTEEAVVEMVDAFGINAVVLSGGDNWGEFPERDRTETLILDVAKARALPVLGVCRGAQVINGFCGGHLEEVCSKRHVAAHHEVQMGRKTIRVNSFHGFGIPLEGLGKNLTPIGMDAQGYVETFFHDNLPWQGILWHPEREETPAEHDVELVRKLFKPDK